ncbi:mannose-1-phosphate guanylyltransferase [Sphingomonas jaspsi]|uniref:mannose-1-phosphate guanylyltransferase n=1 Tax=Sphingomonas jaspsi TaxID=392409 RepID=UPI00055F5B31|nr:sugar phosphate nucleotidyltransferase [Sphingomonas jaspsi]
MNLVDARPVRPVILAGGSGTRLWPLSRSRTPKHLLPLLGNETLFEQTLRRFDQGFAAPMVLANRDQRDALSAVLPDRATLVMEPVRRDSAAAIAVAAGVADDGDLLLICPSDHHISDAGAFHRAIDAAIAVALEGRIVTFGVTPDHPATGYGYIEAGAGEGPRPVIRFVEKPDVETAQAMIADGGHYWNAGIFLALASTWKHELARHAPDILAAALASVSNSRRSGQEILLDEESFAQSPARSIDYAVMEHSDAVSVVPVDMGWSDIGSWQALLDAAARDVDGNSVPDGVLVLDSRNLLVRSSGPKIAAIGVDGLVIVATQDAVLVTRPEHAQRVREAAEWFEKGAGI